MMDGAGGARAERHECDERGAGGEPDRAGAAPDAGHAPARDTPVSLEMSSSLREKR